MASGVLLVLLGQAVRVSEYLLDLPKTYNATVRLGTATTTYDALGEVVHERPFEGISRSDIEEGLREFAGEIMQAPPAYSAVKVGGERAYRLARRGEQVTPSPRRARIHRIDLLRFEPPEVDLEVECGRGTYIRSLAHDLGEALGCGAHLAGLTRTRIGPFGIEGAVETRELEEALQRGEREERLLPLDYGLLHLPAITLHIEDEKDIRHGQSVALDEDRTQALDSFVDGAVARAYAEDGSLVAIIRYDVQRGMWRPRKVFANNA
jgi:tRNA pseudouridine55 synthase